MTSAQREILRRDCEQLCRAVAPVDLAARPIYVLFFSEGKFDVPPFGCGYGCTSPGMDLATKHLIGPAWSGRGPAIAINEIQVELDAQELLERFSTFGAALTPEQFASGLRADLLAITLHEISHVLELGWTYPTISTPNLKTACDMERRHSRLPSPIQNLEAHGPGFIRVVCHAIARAQAGGYRIHPPDAFNPGQYNLRFPLAAYQHALAPEIAASTGKPFRFINSTAPPPALVALFNEDRQDRQQVQQENAA